MKGICSNVIVQYTKKTVEEQSANVDRMDMAMKELKRNAFHKLTQLSMIM